MSTNDVFVLENQAVEKASAYGITYPAHSLASSADKAVEAADGMGYPVVLKIVSPDVAHKSDAGGVAVNLKDAEAVKAAFEKMMSDVSAAVPGADIHGALVCKQANDGLEVIIGGLQDPVFGPTVMFGLGGIFTEILKDVSFRVAPLRPKDAEDMVREIKGYPLLTGARGAEPCDVPALEELLLSVSRMLSEHPEITELDLNPVRVHPKGVTALDVRIMEKGRD